MVEAIAFFSPIIVFSVRLRFNLGRLNQFTATILKEMKILRTGTYLQKPTDACKGEKSTTFAKSAQENPPSSLP
jgi:hypothetical protein